MPLWDQVKSNLVEWYTVAAEKTEELAKIGVRRYDKFGISRDIERQFTELGSFVYNAIAGGGQNFLQDPTLLAIVERIKGLEEDLHKKEEEIDEIRRLHREKLSQRPEKAVARGGATVDPDVAEGIKTSAILVSEGGADKTAATPADPEGVAEDSPDASSPEEGPFSGAEEKD